MQFLLGAFLVFLFPALSFVFHSSPLLLDETPYKAAASAAAPRSVYRAPHLEPRPLAEDKPNPVPDTKGNQGADSSSRSKENVPVASFYAEQFHGKKMENRRVFNMFDSHIAAHRDLPLGTRIRVTNLRNGKSLVAIVQDRGPYAHPEKRILDLSWAAAMRLDFVRQGLAPIRLQVLSFPESKERRAS